MAPAVAQARVRTVNFINGLRHRGRRLHRRRTGPRGPGLRVGQPPRRSGWRPCRRGLQRAGDDPAADFRSSPETWRSPRVSTPRWRLISATGEATLTVYENDVPPSVRGRHVWWCATMPRGPGGRARRRQPDHHRSGQPRRKRARSAQAGDYSVTVNTAGTDGGPGRPCGHHPPGRPHLVHAVGDPATDSFLLVVQTIEGLNPTPSCGR